jgi:hypothetical protein
MVSPQVVPVFVPAQQIDRFHTHVQRRSGYTRSILLPQNLIDDWIGRFLTVGARKSRVRKADLAQVECCPLL